MARPIPLDPPVISAARSAMRARRLCEDRVKARPPPAQPRSTVSYASTPMRIRRLVVVGVASALGVPVLLAGCGSSGGDKAEAPGPPARAQDFPKATGKTL